MKGTINGPIWRRGFLRVSWGAFSSWLASRYLGTARCSYLARVGPVDTATLRHRYMSEKSFVISRQLLNTLDLSRSHIIRHCKATTVGGCSVHENIDMKCLAAMGVLDAWLKCDFGSKSNFSTTMDSAYLLTYASNACSSCQPRRPIIQGENDHRLINIYRFQRRS